MRAIEKPADELLQDFAKATADHKQELIRDPATIFKFATYDIDYIASELESPIRALNRMLFVQYFSAMEAYLSDRLIKVVMDETATMSALVKNNKEWSGEKIPVTELAANPAAYRDWVLTRLRELPYHNFVKIDNYYRGALGFTIFPNKQVKATLMAFLPVRHDCVHRYGYDHEGQERSISKDDLAELETAAEAMVEHIEAAFAQRPT